MAEIIKVYRQRVEPMRFIGKKYGDADRVNGTFAHLWGQWFEQGWFEAIKSQAGPGQARLYDDGEATIGLMRGRQGLPFEYWIGMFTPPGTRVPKGFDYLDAPASGLGVCWIQGKEHEVYALEHSCLDALEQAGLEVRGGWCFERYACPRFTTPDEQGNIILDMCFYIAEPMEPEEPIE